MSGRIKNFIKSKYFLPVVIYVLVLVAVMLMFDRRLQVTHYTVEADDSLQSVRIALLTDLHSSGYGRDCIRLFNAVEKQNPDIVLLGGDIYDDSVPDDNARALVKQLAEKYVCYYVTGNHEFWSNRVDEIKAELKGMGVTVLEGDCKTVAVGNRKINICGVDDPTLDYDKMYSQLKAANTASNNGYFTVLLSHRPEMVQEYARYDFDLVLSGHAHGGQVRIPYLLNGLYAPNQGLFPKYAAGIYDMGGYEMIVSRGLDKEGIRLPRMFNRPELVIVDIS